MAQAGLERLDLSGNFIGHIPAAIKKLTNLGVLRLAHNRITALKEVVKLTGNSNLYNIDLRSNALASLPHYQDFVLYNLPWLQIHDANGALSPIWHSDIICFFESLIPKPKGSHRSNRSNVPLKQSTTTRESWHRHVPESTMLRSCCNLFGRGSARSNCCRSAQQLPRQ